MIGRQDHNGPRGNGVSENLSYTLTATDTPAIAAKEPIPIQDKATRYKGGGPTRKGDGAGNGLGVGKAGDPAPTITARDHHAVAQGVPEGCVDITCSKVGFAQTGYGVLKEGVGVLRANGGDSGGGSESLIVTSDTPQHTVAAVDCRNHRETGEVSGTLQAKENGSYSLNYQNPVRTGYIVRRLTPTECERLQGYPDGWTAIGHDGQEISDTRRYQMLGNSVAIPCVAYILSGIAAQIEKANIEEAA